MITCASLDDIPNPRLPLVLAIGAFDGIHLGHRELIRLARSRADTVAGAAWVMTFEPHPAKLLHPERAPALITTPAQKAAILAGFAVDGCLTLPFTRDFSQLEPEAFIERLCASLPGLQHIVVGRNWHFGHEARGNAALLEELGGHHNFGVTIVGPILAGDSPVSSSRIRSAVRDGEMQQAAAMLGRPFSLVGVVEHGRKVGRELGWPTANVAVENEILPPHGIFAARVSGADWRADAAVYIAKDRKYHPDTEYPVVEAHLLGESRDVYGQTLEIALLERIREDRHFDAEIELREQIAADVNHIREFLDRHPAHAG